MTIRNDNVQEFVSALRATIGRLIDIVLVIPLFGDLIEFPTLGAALDYFDSGLELEPSDSFVRIEVEVRYTNGDTVSGTFSTTRAAADFLHLVGT